MTDEWAEWRQQAAGIVTEEAGLETGMAKAATPDDEATFEELPPEVRAEERALVSIQPQAQHHIVTGMAALARMDDAEYEQAIAVVQRGLARVKDFMQRAMTRGEDYGTVKGIDRPFLHLPGAEKLCLLYGLAARQEAERIEGRHVRLVVGGVETVTDQWETAPLVYHVKTYIHLGSFDGPVVAMGYGEASSWEVKYRYMWAKPACPNCGREGLVKRKSPPQMAGKWNCPSWKDMGGCNATFEAGDQRVQGGKIENTDPYSLAETLLQMAAKRSLVAATRRATGTSGLFTQDDDSPSVQQQADTTPEGDETPAVENVTGQQQVERGGKPAKPTPQQMAELSRLSKEKGLGPDGIARVITRVLDTPVVPMGETRGEQGKWLWAYIEGALSADHLGAVLATISTGEVPEANAEVPA